MIIKFGKYKGRELKDIPQSYLHWILNNLKLDSKTKQTITYHLGIVDPVFAESEEKERVEADEKLNRRVKVQYLKKLYLEQHPEQGTLINEIFEQLVNKLNL